jgi:membrane-bound lytic murein transglycosylase B
MQSLLTKCVLLACVVAAPLALAQSSTPARQPRALIEIYHVAPGKQIAFLKWMADRDAIDQQLGLPRAQWYAHLEGASWDYLAVGPDLTDAQTKQQDDAARAKGLASGPKASIEFRQYIASHTDTLTVGPMTVSDLSARMSKP